MIEKYLRIIIDSFTGYWNYLVFELSNFSWHNYLYWLIGLSLLIWALEIIVPWRKNQPIFRKDFWLDSFYMFFNFFLFSLIGYNAISHVGVELFNDFLALFEVTNIVAFEVQSWPAWTQWLVLFVVADFIQWCVHLSLHRIPFLWEFHKLHHSVKEMGFSAHLRFHWMETIIYKTIQYIPLAMIGFGIQDFFIVHVFTLAVGHLNHSNLNLDYGPLKYVFNNPKMHIWHHARELPEQHRYGVNFGLSLSVWDYVFNTAYIPYEGKDIELGFKGDENFPDKFSDQMVQPFQKKKIDTVSDSGQNK